MRYIFYLTAFIVSLTSCFVIYFVNNKEYTREHLIYKEKSNVDYGDLYNISLIDELKIDLKLIKSHKYDNKTSLNDADVIIAGDSFTKQHDITPRIDFQIQNLTNYKVLNSDYIYSQYPLALFSDNNNAKYLFLESIETFIKQKSVTYLQNLPSINTNTENKSSVLYNNKIAKYFDAFKNNDNQDYNLDEEDYIYFLNNSIFTHRIAKALINIRFKLFGEINENIGYYNNKFNMAFSKLSTDFYYNQPPDERIDEIAAIIKELSTILKEKHNVTLIYVVMPIKLSIYQEYANINDFRFAAKLNSKLEQLGVEHIDMFTALRNAAKKELIYHRGDTHYNYKGRKIFVDKIIEKLDELEKKLKAGG